MMNRWKFQYTVSHKNAYIINAPHFHANCRMGKPDNTKKRGQSMIFLVPIKALGSIQCFETVGWMTEYTPNLAKTCSYLQTEQIKGKRLSL